MVGSFKDVTINNNKLSEGAKQLLCIFGGKIDYSTFNCTGNTDLNGSKLTEDRLVNYNTWNTDAAVSTNFITWKNNLSGVFA